MDCYAGNPDVPADCAGHLHEEPGTVVRPTSTGAYQPVYFLLVGWPSLLLAPEPALRAMRLLTAWLCAGIVGLAAAATQRFRASPIGLAAIAAALPPMALFLFGGLNPNALEIAGAVALWCTTVVITTRPDAGRAEVAWVVAFAATAVARPLSPLVALGIVVAAATAFGDMTTIRRRWHDSRPALLVAAVVVLASLGWVVGTNALATFKGIPAAGSTGEIARHSFSLTGWRLEQMVGLFGWADTPLPDGVLAVWAVGITGLLVAGLVRSTWRQRAVLGGLVAATLLLPVAADVATAHRLGFAWQGRYTLPMAAGIPLLSGLVLARRRATRSGVGLAVAGMAAWTVTSWLAVAASLRRYTVGVHDPRPFWAFLRVDGWQPPLGSGTLLVVSALILALAGTAFLVVALRDVGLWPGPDRPGGLGSTG
jgi:hypothetical protein